MKKSDLIKAGAAIGVLAVAGYLILRQSGKGTGDGVRTYVFRCSQASCRKSFDVPESDYLAVRTTGVGLKCPACSSQEIERGSKCGGCSGFVAFEGHASLPKNCPTCKRSMREAPPAAGG